MKFFRKVDKILASFGNIRALERTHVDTFTENNIKNVSGQKIAESQYGQLWVEFQELAGYEFLNAVILSDTNIKTYNGAKLLFTGKKGDMKLDSDISEIESDYSNISSTWMTKVSFVVTKEQIKFIAEKRALKVEFIYKKKTIPFEVIQLGQETK